MSNKQKTIAGLIAVLLLTMVVVLWNNTTSSDQSMKEITVIIDAEDYHTETTVKSDCVTLKELLQEQKEWQAVMEEGAYGAFLVSLAGYEQDMQKGPWWLYTSDNNAQCQKQGMCPALSELTIQDGDVFHFFLTSDIN